MQIDKTKAHGSRVLEQKSWSSYFKKIEESNYTSFELDQPDRGQ
jgi:hypothetical protein